MRPRLALRCPTTRPRVLEPPPGLRMPIAAPRRPAGAPGTLSRYWSVVSVCVISGATTRRVSVCVWTKLERAMGRVMCGADWQQLQVDQLVRMRNGGLEHRLKIRCGAKVAKVDLTEAEMLEFMATMAPAAAEPGTLASA